MSIFRPILPLAASVLAMAVAPAVRADAPPRGGAGTPATPGDPLADYVRARIAGDLGQLGVAAQGYAAASSRNPDDMRLGLLAFRQAVTAGDFALAARQAQALDARHSLPPDGTLLLIADAVQRRDWKRARVLVTRVEEERLFAFMAPVLSAWIAFGAHQGDPVAPLNAVPAGGMASAYADEHRALLLIAMGKDMAGVAAIGALQMPDGARSARLRIAAAAMLDRHHDRDAALAILAGNAPPIVAARATLQAHDRLAGAIDTPLAGIAELYVRVAADINRQEAGALALSFARMATMLAPDASEGWLVTADLLSLGGADAAALDAVAHIPSDDPFAVVARDTRVKLLARAGRRDQALAEAEGATRSPEATADDWSRYGDMLMLAKRSADAAAAYGRALSLLGDDRAPAGLAWPLLLQQANALLEAGDWSGAKEKARKALALAPTRPEVLNFLGYSELEHGGDPAAAGALIARASALAPDDPSITDSLGWSWYLRGRVDRAIPLLERAAQAAPAESEINEHLGDAYWKADRKLAARYAWRAALVAAEDGQAERLKAKIDYGLTEKP